MDVQQSDRVPREGVTAVEPLAVPVVAMESALSPTPRGLWRDAWMRLKRNRFAIAGALVLIAIVLIAIAAPVVAPYDPIAQDYDHLLQGPSLHHFFGTDNFGRDIFSRIIYGGRISLTVGILGTLFGLAIGVVVGLIAGFYGSWVDSLAMRLLDILLAFPGLLLAITIVAVLGVGTQNVIIAIGIFSLPSFARILRGSILSLKQAGPFSRSNNRSSSRLLARVVQLTSG
jgi:glutathione transport system permease protein